MTRNKAPYYRHPRETWTKARCARFVRHLAKDGVGTPYPFRGAFVRTVGLVRYNGGTVIGETWYAGEVYYLPKVPQGYTWKQIPSWCWRLVACPA